MKTTPGATAFLLEVLNQRTPERSLSLPDEEALLALVNEHKIEGYVHPYLHLLRSTELVEHIEITYRRNTLQNLILKENWNEIQNGCAKENIAIAGLKGIDLIQWLVPPSARPLTDIDAYVSSQDLPALSKILKKLNYSAVDESKWFANSHKHTYKSATGLIETTLEVHTQLFYNEAEKSPWNFERRDHGLSLTVSDQIIYLSYHLAHQHTFLKLFWLMDLARLTEKYPAAWSPELFKKAHRTGAFQAVLSVALVLNRFFKADIKMPEARIKTQHRLTWDFLINPESNRWHYYAVKHLIKDSLAESLAYDWGWLKHRWKDSGSPKSIDGSQ